MLEHLLGSLYRVQSAVLYCVLVCLTSESAVSSEVTQRWTKLEQTEYISSQLTKDFFNVSKELAYNIFFLILAESGHQDIRNSFCFLELSAVPLK